MKKLEKVNHNLGIDVDVVNYLNETRERVNELIERAEGKEEWKQGEKYWYFRDNGISDSLWHDDIYDRARQNFLGIFRTESEALAQVSKIKQLLK